VSAETATIEAKPTVRVVKETYPEAIKEIRDDYGDLKIVIEPEALLKVAELLKTHPDLQYDYLMDIATVDRYRESPRFEVVYNFYSLAKKKRVRIHVRLSEKNPEVDSLTPLWKGADWFEREGWDMMGIRFRGHPRLRRILTHPEFVGHPLRKDYNSAERHPLSRNYDLYAPDGDEESKTTGEGSA
jgi:NADH-quinone oxidoreductase subunit C